MNLTFKARPGTRAILMCPVCGRASLGKRGIRLLRRLEKEEKQR